MSIENRKLRYVNDVVGGFVLLAFLFFAGGIFFAGRAQGWFEGSIEVEAKFTDSGGLSSDKQGSFDLQEGDEVKIRSALAGSVKSISPADDGGLKAVLLIKRRFHRYVSVDSVARVKKKFGLAGDAYVEINEGKGAQIEDGGTILCYKDEELMEIAQRVLDSIEEAVVPMVTETTGVMSNANRIAGQVSSGEGLVGTIISDPTLTADVREAIDRMNTLIGSTEEAVKEATRLIKGAQKSWLVRNHIPDREGKTYLSPLFPVYGETDAELRRKCEEDLKRARIDACAADVLRAACNLAMCRGVDGNCDAARLLLQEANFSNSGSDWDRIQLASLRLLCGDEQRPEREALAIKDIINNEPDGMDYDDYSEYVVAAILALSPDSPLTTRLIETQRKRLQKKGSPEAKAGLLKVQSTVAGRVNALDAAKLADAEAEQLAAAGLKKAMAEALGRSGDMYTSGKAHDTAALRYLLAGKSLGAQGFVEKSDAILKKASLSSQESGNEALTRYIGTIYPLNSPKSAK